MRLKLNAASLYHLTSSDSVPLLFKKRCPNPSQPQDSDIAGAKASQLLAELFLFIDISAVLLFCCLKVQRDR